MTNTNPQTVDPKNATYSSSTSFLEVPEKWSVSDISFSENKVPYKYKFGFKKWFIKWEVSIYPDQISEFEVINWYVNLLAAGRRPVIRLC